MKITLIYPQTKAPPWVDAGCETYRRRLQSYCKFNINNIQATKNNKNMDSTAMRRKETSRLLDYAGSQDYLIACDEHGKPVNSKKIASTISSQQDLGRNINIIIGGADGLDKNQITKCDALWSLSQLTMPQHLALIVVVEQIYRAYTLITNHPYHRGS